MISVRPRRLLAAVLAAPFAILAACESPTPPPGQCAYSEWNEQIVVASGAMDDVAGQCMKRAPDINDDGTPNCVVLEAHQDGPCDCATPGLGPVDAKYQGAIDAAKDIAAPVDLTCFCQIAAVTGAALTACQDDATTPVESGGKPVDGYCWIDPANGLGNKELVASCAATEQRLIRFVGDVSKPDAQQIFMFCAAKDCGETDTSGQ